MNLLYSFLVQFNNLGSHFYNLFPYRAALQCSFVLSAWFVIQYLLGWVRRSAGTQVVLRWFGYAVWTPNLRWSPILPSDGSPLVKILSQM